MTTAMVLNSNVVEMEYAVRGPIPLRAAELARDGRLTIPCNIGNPQALGQRPITYYRQVLSLLEAPDRIGRERRLTSLAQQHPDLADKLLGEAPPPHVLDVAEELASHLATGTGAYTESAGFRFVREAVARFIDQRDGVESGSNLAADPDAIFLTNGASEAAKNLLEMLIAGPNDGIMIPIPQYPLYSAAIRKNGGVQVDYHPDEEGGWRLSRQMIEEPLLEAQQRGVRVKAIVVINPGNPTGAILDEASVQEVVEVAEQYGLAIIADEVYQENHYGQPWVSFAKVVGSRPVPLFSLHSVSKGFYGECGHRGGYVEVRHPPAITAQGQSFMDVLVKQASVSLCSNTSGQIMTYLMVRPPDEGTTTHQLFCQERDAVLADLLSKATMIKEGFKAMDGVEVFGRVGAMYLFPRLNQLPQDTDDFAYCMALLEETGLCTVNGSGFGQRAGTHHLRIAFLPPKELLEKVLPKWIEFHNRYVGA